MHRNKRRPLVASGWVVAYRRYSLAYVVDEDVAQRNNWPGDFEPMM